MRKIPASAAFANEDVRLGWRPIHSSSTGAAVGETPEDAVRRAVLERIERDAVAIWWYNRLVPPRLAPEAAMAALPVELAGYLLGRRRQTWHLLARTDLPVPAVVSLSAAADGRRVAIGAAAALDPADAVRSATLEMLQCEVALSQMRAAQRGEGPPPAPPLLRWSEATRAAAVPKLAGSAAAPLPPPVPYEALLDALADRNIDITIVDLTRPEFDIPVMRAVSTVLRDWQPRFAPGRLYDVPVALGWRTTPTAEADLNPVPFVI